MKIKRILALLLALCLALTLAACRAEETVAEAPPPPIVNDGAAAQLVLGEVAQDAERTAVLREMADKYEADFPNTKIEIRTFDDASALEAALRAGELDIAEVNNENQVPLVRDGLLYEIALRRWEEGSTLTPAATQAAKALSDSRAYLIPCELEQDVLFYRSDWFDAYNEGKTESEGVYCRTWKQIITAAERLGDKGRLAFAGRDCKLAYYFEAIVWSSLGGNRILSPAAADYLYSAEGTPTIFTHQRAAEGVDQFVQVMEKAALPKVENWDLKMAVEAFCNEEAGILIADRSVIPTLRENMPEGSWTEMEFPRGLTGTAVFPLNSYRGWAVVRDGKTPETALHFVTFLSNADNNTHYAKVRNTLPIHTEAASLEPSLLEGDLRVEIGMLNYGSWYQYANDPLLCRRSDGYIDRLNNGVRALLPKTVYTGSPAMEPEELLHDLDAYWQMIREIDGEPWR